MNNSDFTQLLEETTKKFSRKINIKSVAKNKPEPLDHLWPGGPLAGVVGTLVAPGATGKSYVALQIAAAITAHDTRADLLGLNIEKFGKVVYFSLEDPEPVLHHRLHDLCQHFDDDMIEKVDENLSIISLCGELIDIMHREIDKDTNEESPFTDYSMICDMVRSSRLCIIDTFNRIHTLEENSNKEMAQVVRRLETLATQAGATVMYLHHVNKASAKEGGDEQQAGRGASALVDNPRWCGNLIKMTREMSYQYVDLESGAINEDDAWLYVGYNASKQNYGTPIVKTWFKRHKGGILKAANVEHVGRPSRKKQAQDEVAEDRKREYQEKTGGGYNMAMRPVRDAGKRW